MDIPNEATIDVAGLDLEKLDRLESSAVRDAIKSVLAQDKEQDSSSLHNQHSLDPL
ncbi:MAG TPA: hypothetical protein VGG39_14610 [Polyangiaceae bacterium]|jgi:hypothetical protein